MHTHTRVYIHQEDNEKRDMLLFHYDVTITNVIGQITITNVIGHGALILEERCVEPGLAQLECRTRS